MSNNRRQFLKNSIGTAAAAGFATFPAIANMPVSTDVKKQKNKHWVWINPDRKDEVSVLKKRYKAYYDAGIRGLLFEADSEKHYTEAKNAGLEAHRWNWTMNRGDVLKQHPEWSAISRTGDSCVTKPPYVGYYKWLCPSKPEVQDFLKNEADTILSKNYIDGLHLDYIRFCDVVLPLNLWDTYKLDQRTELPAYDFCYCKTCRDAYAAKTGNDPLSLRYPDAQVSWRLFRYQAINNVVNDLAVVAHEHHKKISAAVFPMPELARRMVRQDWTNWNLDMVFPMIYHGFYQEGVSNAIAIGQGSTNSTSNSMVLGNTSITKVSTSGAIVTTNDITAKHIKGNSGALSIAASTGAGTSPSAVSVTGTDVSGVVALTTGTSPTVNAVLATITYNTAFSTAPVVVITPANAATASLAATQAVWVNITTTGFTINTNGTAVGASTAYKWNYVVIQ